MIYRVYLGMGSNLGDRLGFLRKAIDLLGKETRTYSLSSIYETEPVNIVSAELFLNLAIGIETTMHPSELLPVVKSIEQKLGRTPDTHMKSREIDIDILLYENFAFLSESIKVPHAGLAKRRFALTPLDEIASSVVDPESGYTIRQLLDRCEDTARVEKSIYTISLSR